MPSPPRSALALAAALLSSCASPRAGSAPNDAREGTDLDVSSAAWVNGALDRSPNAAVAAPNRALKPDVPWMGTIGVKGIELGDYELGGGVFVPTLGADRFQSPVPADRIRETGVGVWLKIDF